MDYKKKHKEEVVRATQLWECGDITRENLEYIFPELKESEDEKIRKLLINLANQTWDGADCFKDFSKEKILAWLEKQGEPAEINPSEFDLRLNKLLKQFETLPKEELASSLSFYLNVVQNDGTYKAEEKQGEQPRYSIGDVLCDKSCTTLNKDAQPNFEIVDIRNGMYICDKCSFPISQQDEYELVAKKIEQKPAEEYNGEDYGIDSLWHAKNILEETLGKVDGYQSDDGILEHKCAISAVNKLYKRKPAEWSEEDEKMRNNLIRLLIRLSACTHTNSTSPSYSYPCEIDWLKSLRPQNHWKPTEEQIRSLHDLNLTGNISYAGQGQTLIELYEQLKKL